MIRWPCTNFLTRPSAYLPTCLPTYLFTCLPTYLSTYLSIYLFIYLYLPTYTYLSIPTVYTYCLYLLSIPTYLPIIYTYYLYLLIYTTYLCYCLYLPIYNLGERLARSKALPNLIN